MSDVRFGLRQMIRNPGFTLVAVGTLAVGIGANTLIFSFLKAILLPPVPFDDRVVVVRMTNPDVSFEDVGCLYDDTRIWDREAESFAGFAPLTLDSMRWTGGDRPEMISSLQSTSDLFEVLRMPATIGRAFTADEVSSGARVVVLAHPFWRTAFDADPAVLGRTIRLDGEAKEIIGVADPRLSRYSQWSDTDVFLPLSLPADYGRRGGHNYFVVARLAPGTSRAAAQAELETIQDAIRRQDPESSRGYHPRVRDAQGYLVLPEAPRAMALLALVVALVLLLASANVANLLLSRASSRAHEVAVRTALGAGRLRIIRQVLTESLLLALAGGAAGIVLAAFGIELLVPLVPSYVLGLAPVAIDGGAMLFTLLASVVTTLLFGLAPALHVAGGDAGTALKEGSRGGGDSRGRWRSVLMGLEVAIAVVLLIGAGLAIQSFLHLRTIPTGFDTGELLVASVALPPEVYPEPARRRQFFSDLIENLEARSEVSSAAAMYTLPLYGTSAWTEVEVEGRPAPEDSPRQLAGYMPVTPGYFEMMAIPLLEGTRFTAQDVDGRPPVAVINEAMARRYWPGESSVGRRFRRVADTDQPWVTVVGVVRNNLHRALDEAPRPELFLPVAQTEFQSLQVAVRPAGGDASSLEDVLRAEVVRLDPEQPIYSVNTMDEVLDLGLAIWPLVASTLAVFSSIALLLACVGVYGVMSFSVSRRTREVAIRIALGAQARDVVRMVIRGGLRVVSIGLFFGLLGALALGQFLRGQLFGVQAADPATFAGMTAVLLGVTVLACWIPARRATRVDPMTALRMD